MENENLSLLPLDGQKLELVMHRYVAGLGKLYARRGPVAGAPFGLGAWGLAPATSL